MLAACSGVWLPSCHNTCQPQHLPVRQFLYPEPPPSTHTHTHTHTPAGSQADITTAARTAQLQDEGSLGAGASSRSVPTAAATKSGRTVLEIPLQHCGVHWVAADARLLGALSRVPLRVWLWRAHERPPAASASTSQQPAPSVLLSPWLSTQVCLCDYVCVFVCAYFYAAL